MQGLWFIQHIHYAVTKFKKHIRHTHAGTSTPQFSLERTERNLTSNINRISIISDSGEEVQYAVVSKPNSEALLINRQQAVHEYVQQLTKCS